MKKIHEEEDPSTSSSSEDDGGDNDTSRHITDTNRDPRYYNPSNPLGFKPHRFYPYMVPDNLSCIVYGSRRAGKTFW